MVVLSEKSVLKKTGLEFLSSDNSTAYVSYTWDRIKYGASDIAIISSSGIDLGDKKLTTAYIPSQDYDVVNKAYLDGVAQGITIKKSVRLASTENVPLNSGEGNISEGGGIVFAPFIDGVEVAVGDRVLLKNQTDAKENGIYVFGDNNNFTRAVDMDIPSEVRGAFTFVEAGSVNANQGFVQTGGAIATVGVDPILFTQFSGTGSLTNGDGLNKDGNTISLNNDYVKNLFNATKASGDGNLSYDSESGVFTYTGPSASETREYFDISNVAGGDGSLAYDKTTGVITYTGPNTNDLVARLNDSASTTIAKVGNKVEVSVKDTYIRGLIDIESSTGDGDLSYNNTTGKFTYIGPSDTEIWNHFNAPSNASGYGNLAYSKGTGTFTYTGVSSSEIRGEFKAEHGSGFGNLTYTEAEGKFIHTGVSTTEIRNQFSAGTGVSITSGQISIGQPVGANDDVTFNTVTTTSDERKKKNIEDLKNSDDLYKLRCVSFNWKDPNADQRTKYGFIAQEVQKVLPSIVNDFGTHMGIDYFNIISLLVKEVQILRADVNKLISA